MDYATELAELERERSEAVLALNGEPTNTKRPVPLDPPNLRSVKLGEPVELWWRNPQQAIDLVKTLAFPRFVIPASALKHITKSPYEMLNSVLPATVDWRLWVVGSDGARMYNRGTPPDRTGAMTPARSAPVWSHGDDPDDLIKLCRAYDSAGWDRIFIAKMPVSRSGRSGSDIAAEQSRTYDYLHRVGASFPNVRLHLTGQHSWRLQFGLNFTATDVDPTKNARKFVILPNGSHATLGDAMSRSLKWIHVLGYSVADLRTYDKRVAFNLHSAQWASENYSSEAALASSRHHIPGKTDPLGLFAVRGGGSGTDYATRRPMATRMRPPELDADKMPQMSPVVDGVAEPYHLAEPVKSLPLVPVEPRVNTGYDKILCDPCSLRDKCRHFRSEGLCILPSSPASNLARLFATRDAEQIRLALSAVLQHQADRLNRISDAWDSDDISDLHTDEVVKRSDHQMKLENSLARGAEAMIKILDPSQRVTTTIPAINAGQVHVYNPNVLVADLVGRLEKAGVKREDIDPSMIIDVAREKGMLEAGS